MKQKYRLIAALLSLCMCLAPSPMMASADETESLSAICAEADAARSDYRIRTLDFPCIDRSDMTDGLVSKLADDCYVLKSWGVIHAEDYINTNSSRGPYYSATAIVNRQGDLLIPWQPTMNAVEVLFEDDVYSIVYTNGLNATYWKENMSRTVSEYYDVNGNVLFEHEPFAAAGPMQDGVAWVAYASDDSDYPLVQLIDKTGTKIADLSDKHFVYIHDYSEGLANFSYIDADEKTHYGYLDKTGKCVLESDNPCGDFHNGLAWMQIDGKYGFMDTAGELVIPAEFDALGDSNGFTAESLLVKKNENWALMDTTGKFLTDFIYERRPLYEDTLESAEMRLDSGESCEGRASDAGKYPFTDGFATVYRNGRYCLLDTKGNELMTGSEYPLHAYGNDVFGIEKGWFSGVFDLVDRSGETIFSQNIGSLVDLGDGVFWVVTDGNYKFFEIEPTAATMIPGDTNDDGTLDIMDVILLNKYLLGSAKLDAAAQKAADMNGDEKIDSTDSLEVLKAVLGIQSEPIAALVTLSAHNLSAAYSAQEVQTVAIDEQTILGQTKFALDLLRESAEPGKNSLISPYSVSQVLGMTANGAAGNTVQEMETVLGVSMETLNPAFYTLRTRDTHDAKYVNANSIWMKDSYFTEHPVNPDFLQTNADYYGADVFTAPFDNTTLNDILPSIAKHNTLCFAGCAAAAKAT